MYRLIPLLCCLSCSAPPADPSPPATSVTQAEPKIQELTIAARGNLMAFDQGELRARAGGKIRLTFSNPKNASMNHNIFIVQAGNSQAVAEQCSAEGLVEPNAEALKSIIAHSETIGPGQKTTIEFETPPPGRYEYVCTVRGHSQTMRGWLIVEPSP